MEIGVIDFTESERSLGSAYVQLITRFKHIKQFFNYAIDVRKDNLSYQKIDCTARLEERRLEFITENTLLIFKNIDDKI